MSWDNVSSGSPSGLTAGLLYAVLIGLFLVILGAVPFLLGTLYGGVWVVVLSLRHHGRLTSPTPVLAGLGLVGVLILVVSVVVSLS